MQLLAVGLSMCDPLVATKHWRVNFTYKYWTAIRMPTTLLSRWVLGCVLIWNYKCLPVCLSIYFLAARRPIYLFVCLSNFIKNGKTNIKRLLLRKITRKNINKKLVFNQRDTTNNFKLPVPSVISNHKLPLMVVQPIKPLVLMSEGTLIMAPL